MTTELMKILYNNLTIKDCRDATNLFNNYLMKIIRDSEAPTSYRTIYALTALYRIAFVHGIRSERAKKKNNAKKTALAVWEVESE